MFILISIQIIQVYISSSIFVEYKWFFDRSIWPTDGILAGTTTLNQSWLGSNGNEGVLYTLQISRTGASLSDAV